MQLDMMFNAIYECDYGNDNQFFNNIKIYGKTVLLQLCNMYDGGNG